MTASITVVFIAGSPRNGSGHLGATLGEIDGFFAAGEVRCLWERGLDQGRPCACGQPLWECPVWSQVLHVAYGGAEHADVAGTIALQRYIHRLRRLPLLLRGHDAQASALHTYRDRLGGLFAALQATTGANVLVDASNLPTYGQVLAGIPEIDLRVVHLVRDARSGWSSRATSTDHCGERDEQGTLEAATRWTTWNLLAEGLWGRSDRYIRIRYEDLANEPEATLHEVLAAVGRPDAVTPALTPATGPRHGIGGGAGPSSPAATPSQPGRAAAARALRDRLKVTCATAPLLARYGYLL